MTSRLRSILAVGLLLAMTGAAGWLGLQKLDHRPVHADESVHAQKFGAMLEKPGLGQYQYDPTEYHGPTLYYATHLVVQAYGKTSLEALEARHLRTTSVMFGAGLILLLGLLVDGLSRGGALVAGLLTLVSPVVAYFSRDFIHETTFVFFTLFTIAAGWRYTRAVPGGWARSLWAIAVGAGVGLMWASKEQFVIVLGAMTGAVVVNAIVGRIGPYRRPRGSAQNTVAPFEAGDTGVAPSARWYQRLPWRDLALALAALLAVWVTLFSSFFTNWQGVADSVATYFSYLGRGMGEGQAAEIHVKPWWYYPWLLGWVSYPPAPVWTHALILGLALIGALVGFVPRFAGWLDARLARFLALYGVALLVALSLIPYKQPWLVMGPLHALILLAGIGAIALGRAARHGPAFAMGLSAVGVLLLVGYAALPYQPDWFWIGGISALVVAASISLAAMMRLVPRAVAPIAVASVLAVGIAHLAHQTRWISGRYAADFRNPLAYAQTSTDVRELVTKLDQLAAHHPRGRSMTVFVVARWPWPLPWYLRRFDNVQIADQTGDIPTQPYTVPVMIVELAPQQLSDGAAQPSQPTLDEMANKHLRGQYKIAHFGLRPDTYLKLYVEQSLWQRFMADRQ